MSEAQVHVEGSARAIAPKRDQPEFRLQCVVADFLALALDQIICPWTALPFGEDRTSKTGERLKRMGVQRGWPDLAFILEGGRIGFIELKPPGKYQSAWQRDFETRVTKLGAVYTVCRTLAEVEGTLRGWGVKLRASAA